MALTPMKRVSDHFTVITNALASHYRVQELNGRDQKYSSREVGPKKTISSDYIKIFRPLGQPSKANSFAFSFNNYHTSECGVIVSVIINKIQEKAFYSFREFQPLLKTFKLELLSSKAQTPKEVSLLVKQCFKTNENNEINLNMFFQSLLSQIQILEPEFTDAISQISELRATEKAQRKFLTTKLEKDQLKSATQRAVEVEVHKSNLTRERARSIITTLRDAELASNPCLTLRLMGRILQGAVASYTGPSSFKSLLTQELKAEVNYATFGESFSD